MLGKTILYLLLQCVKALFLVKTMYYFVNELLRSSGHAYFAGQEYKYFAQRSHLLEVLDTHF